MVFEELAPGDMLGADNRGRTASDFTSVLESGLEEASDRLRAIVAQGKDASGGTGPDWELVHVLNDIESAREEKPYIQAGFSS